MTGPHWLYFCIHLIVTFACLRVCGEKSPEDVIFVTEKVTASDYLAGDYFGYSVSTYGGYAIIGALYNDDDDNGENSGSAYIFERNESNDTNATNGTNETWIETQKLIASDGIEDARFGAEKNGVAISGNYAIVGAYKDDDGFRSSGSAYMFERNIDNGSWIEVQKLVANDAGIDRRFGTCVDIDGDFAIVGSTGNAPGGSFSASAYIFERRSSSDGLWIQTAKLSVDDAAAEERFATSLSISGSIAIVGAQWDDVDGKNGTQYGSAYIFERSNISGTWNLTSKIVASDGAPGDVFGRSVSIFGDLVIVGAYLDDGHGSAYIFERDLNGSWIEMDKLVAHDAAQNDQFGHDVSINEHYAIVGAVGASVNGTTSGSVYIFKRDVLGGSWNQVAKLVPNNVTENGKFGHSVWISEEDIAVMGAFGQEAAYFYQISFADSHTNEPTNIPSLMPSISPQFSSSVNGDTDTNDRTVLMIVAFLLSIFSFVACVGCTGWYLRRKDVSRVESKMSSIHPPAGVSNDALVHSSNSSKFVSEWKPNDVRQWMQKILYKNANLASEKMLIDSFMKEFEENCINGKILMSLVKSDEEIEKLKQRFSKENQSPKIWSTLKNELKALVQGTNPIENSRQSASSIDVAYVNVEGGTGETVINGAESGLEEGADAESVL